MLAILKSQIPLLIAFSSLMLCMCDNSERVAFLGSSNKLFITNTRPPAEANSEPIPTVEVSVPSEIPPPSPTISVTVHIATPEPTVIASLAPSPTPVVTASVRPGCAGSASVAFVDCSEMSGTTSKAKIIKGDVNLTEISCNEARSNFNIFLPFDTIVYFGPLNIEHHNKDQKAGVSPTLPYAALPPPIDARLISGAKVIVVPTYDNTTGFSEFPFYGLTIETNIEFHAQLGTATIDKPNNNKMSDAFNANNYKNSPLSHLMFLGIFNTAKESDPVHYTEDYKNAWCSNLVGTTEGARTTFHAYMLDAPNTKGFLIASTIANPEAGSNTPVFDFTEPFLKSQITQPWSMNGNSKKCGLPCVPFVTVVGMGKPVIYLYPQKETDITVKLDLAGKIETSYPEYDQNLHGWQVHAKPNGELRDKRDGKEYSYIYWSGTSSEFKPNFEEGFVVKGEDTLKFLQKTLSQMGMLPREYNDMIVYWLPYMKNHPYNIISFAQESYTKIAKMQISPSPDSELRVFMTFKKLEKPVDIKPQKLQKFKRKGFVVVEWGGSEIDGEWSVLH